MNNKLKIITGILMVLVIVTIIFVVKFRDKGSFATPEISEIRSIKIGSELLVIERKYNTGEVEIVRDGYAELLNTFTPNEKFAFVASYESLAEIKIVMEDYSDIFISVYPSDNTNLILSVDGKMKGNYISHNKLEFIQLLKKYSENRTGYELVLLLQKDLPVDWTVNIENAYLVFTSEDMKTDPLKYQIVDYISKEEFTKISDKKQAAKGKMDDAKKEIKKRGLVEIDDTGKFHALKRVPKTEDDKKLFVKYDELDREYKTIILPDCWYKDITLVRLPKLRSLDEMQEIIKIEKHLNKELKSYEEKQNETVFDRFGR